MTNLLSFITAWYNLPFSILLILCVLLGVLQLVGLGGEGSEHDADADTDADAGIDHDADLDHDADIDHDADLGHDADLDHDLGHDLDHDVSHDVDHDMDHGGDHGADAGSPGVLSVLAFIGMGKAPLAVVLLTLFGSIGILGWLLNSLALGAFGSYPGIVFAGVLPATLLGGGLISSRITRFIGRALPPISTTATRAQALVGRRGAVTSPFVDAKYGMVRVRDQAGTMISVFAVYTGSEPIKRGSEVVLVSYDAQRRIYTVAPIDR